jgi:hypothetical protein
LYLLFYFYCLWRCFLFASSAPFAAIFYFFPIFLPLFAPGKRQAANNTNFYGQVFFFMCHSCNNIMLRLLQLNDWNVLLHWQMKAKKPAGTGF